jgi:histidine triad (HIT) family protein
VSTDCLFCRIVAGDEPARLVLQTDDVVALLDARPVFKGHTLVLPRRHVVTLPDLPDDLLTPYFKSVRLLSRAMVDAYECQGTFVAVNNVVSQSVAHLHVHVVPRTKGDGLRGFFWPRTKYADDAEAANYADRLRAALDGLVGS